MPNYQVLKEEGLCWSLFFPVLLCGWSEVTGWPHFCLSVSPSWWLTHVFNYQVDFPLFVARFKKDFFLIVIYSLFTNDGSQLWIYFRNLVSPGCIYFLIALHQNLHKIKGGHAEDTFLCSQKAHHFIYNKTFPKDITWNRKASKTGKHFRGTKVFS